MEFDIEELSKKEIVVHVDEKDPTIFQLLVERLNKMPDVEFAAYRWDHPLSSSPEMRLRVKKGSAKDFLLNVVEDIKKEFESIEKKIR